MLYKTLLNFVMFININGQNLVCQSFLERDQQSSFINKCSSQTMLMKGLKGQKGSNGTKGLKGFLGETGDPGRNGTKGEKGETGKINLTLIEEINSNFTAILNQTSMEVGSLVDKVERLNNIVQGLSDGWKLFGNYLYKQTAIKASWEETRIQCKQWGADLAVHGIQNKTTRNIILDQLFVNSSTWMGLSDYESEGNWTWVNGDSVEDEDGTLWAGNEPDSGETANCGGTFGKGKTLHDLKCGIKNLGLCEK